MKGNVRVTINRETLKELLQAHINTTMLHDFDLKEFTIHRTGSIELVIAQRPASTLPLEAGTGAAEGEDAGL